MDKIQEYEEAEDRLLMDEFPDALPTGSRNKGHGGNGKKQEHHGNTKEKSKKKKFGKKDVSKADRDSAKDQMEEKDGTKTFEPGNDWDDVGDTQNKEDDGDEIREVDRSDQKVSSRDSTESIVKEDNIDDKGLTVDEKTKKKKGAKRGEAEEDDDDDGDDDEKDAKDTAKSGEISDAETEKSNSKEEAVAEKKEKKSWSKKKKNHKEGEDPEKNLRDSSTRTKEKGTITAAARKDFYDLREDDEDDVPRWGERSNRKKFDEDFDEVRERIREHERRDGRWERTRDEWEERRCCTRSKGRCRRADDRFSNEKDGKQDDASACRRSDEYEEERDLGACNIRACARESKEERKCREDKVGRDPYGEYREGRKTPTRDKMVLVEEWCNRGSDREGATCPFAKEEKKNVCQSLTEGKSGACRELLDKRRELCAELEERRGERDRRGFQTDDRDERSERVDKRDSCKDEGRDRRNPCRDNAGVQVSMADRDEDSFKCHCEKNPRRERSREGRDSQGEDRSKSRNSRGVVAEKRADETMDESGEGKKDGDGGTVKRGEDRVDREQEKDGHRCGGKPHQRHRKHEADVREEISNIRDELLFLQWELEQIKECLQMALSERNKGAMTKVKEHLQSNLPDFSRIRGKMKDCHILKGKICGSSGGNKNLRKDLDYVMIELNAIKCELEKLKREKR